MAQAGESQRSQPEQQSQRSEHQSQPPARGREGAVARSEPRMPSGAMGAMGPFTFLRRFAEQMDRLFDDLGFGPSPDIQLLSRGAPMWSPPVETFERDDRMVVRVDLPGLKPSDVNLELTEEGLVIQGERRDEREQREGGYYRTERRYGTFVRLVPLPEGIDPAKVEATFRDGVLEVAVPLSQAQSRRRRIEIRGGGGEETSTSRGAATGGAASAHGGDPAAREAQQGKSAGTGKTGEARK